MDRIAGITSNTVPWEILRAGGYAPRLLEAEPGPTPYADRYMEDVFERRIRVIFDRLCAGSWKDLDVVVIPRTSEQEHKLYLYLQEMKRTGDSQSIPPLYFYNLPHTRTQESYDYGLERTRQMVMDFAASEDNLLRAIFESNHARAVVRDVLKRRRSGLLEGSTALSMVRGFYSENRETFPNNLREKLKAGPSTNSGARPRILIKGASLDHTVLHVLVESLGGYVVAEDDWRGSRAAGELDVDTIGDPVTAIFEKYFYDEASPRVHPPNEADAWFHREIDRSQVDGVIFYIPLEDDVVGWDYPRHLAYLETRGVRSLLIRESAALEPSSQLSAQVAGFIDMLRRG